ncbi:hypothetical protein [Haliscomenobacter sp.]|uniref:hypothetical protein n=1 Tax=Haliscomenobacter sp. TaxID=2717303 RepID=UPI003BAB4398
MKTLFVLISSLFVGFIQGQNYIPYYTLVNEGNKLLYHKKYQEAADQYEKAMKLVKYVHCDTYTAAAIAQSHLNQYKKATAYLEKSIEQGGNYYVQIQGASFQEKYTNTPAYEQLTSENAPLFKVEFNSTYIHQLDSLYHIDQDTLRKDGKHQESAMYSDSLNFAALLKLIDKYGFPSEQIVGLAAAHQAEIIIHHNARLPKNEAYWPLWQDAVKKGELNPEVYAWMYDQYLAWFKKESPYFYHCIAPIDKLSKAELELVDQHRKEWGVPTLAAFAIETTGGGMSFTKLY